MKTERQKNVCPIYLAKIDLKRNGGIRTVWMRLNDGDLSRSIEELDITMIHQALELVVKTKRVSAV